MRPRTPLLAALACAVAFAAPFAAVAGEKIVKNGDTLVFMGDSITWYGVTNRHGYVNLVVRGLAANGIDVTWYGAGVKGDKSAAMLARFDADVIAHDPDVVTISAGVNDVWYQDANSTYEKFYANELQMVAKTKAAGAVPVLLSPTTAAGEAENGEIRRYAAGVREIAAAEGIPYADTFHAVRGWINDIDNPRLSGQEGYNMGGRAATVDGVHMAPTGDRQMARAVLAAFGLDAAEMSAAEAAWNADETLIVKETYSDEPSAAVHLAAAEYAAFESAAAARGLSVDAFAKQVFRQGIDSLAANPANESEAAGASIALTASVPVSFAGYDKLLHAADRIDGTFDDACKSALLRGVRECAAYAAPAPAAPVLEEFFVQPASTVVTLSGMIASPGAGASACDIAFACGTDADSLGPEQIVLAGQRNRFVAWIKGLTPGTTYHWTASVVNNATGRLATRRQGSFTTAASGTGALEPSGDDDTAALQSAIDAAAATGGTVTLAGGTYLVDAELAITGDVTVAGSGWRTTTIRQRATQRVATLDGGSTLRGVTLTGGVTSGGYNHGGGAYLSDGHLVECRVLKNLAGATGNSCFGGGIFLDKGTVERCAVVQNQVGMKGATYCAGGGIGCRDQTARGEAVVDACLVCGNRAFGNGGGIGLDLFYKNYARTVRNTTIVGNRASGTGGGVHSANDTNKKASLVDGIVAGNASGAAAKTVDMSYTGGVDYCLFDVEADKLGDNSATGDPRFGNAAAGIFTIAQDSPAKGAGTATGVVLDLAGNDFANPPSMGCYEYGSVSDGEGLGPGGGEGGGGQPAARPRAVFSID